ncbi:MAG: prolyl oligopeptidase family serine peptidase [Asticcacaulis sp.]|nr:prolyl oligopeptidase family serine peptidase [Asticcacaulis sp.]
MHADTAAQPTRIVVLSDGPDNVLTGNWPDRVFTVVNRAELHAFEIASPKGVAIVCGGGGYIQLVHDREGVEVALWLNGLGFNAYVLVHRLPGNGNAKDVALTDALAAFEHIPDTLPRIAVGLSSGGHLAGTIACQAEADIKAAIIAYAPVNANHRDYKAPAGKPDFPPPEKQAFYNDWPIGIAAEPHGVPPCPVFLAYALHDTAVPVEHALNFIKTARDLKLDLDAHIFGQAPHGFALRDTSGTHRDWPSLAEAWLNEKLSG